MGATYLPVQLLGLAVRYRDGSADNRNFESDRALVLALLNAARHTCPSAYIESVMLAIERLGEAARYPELARLTSIAAVHPASRTTAASTEQQSSPVISMRLLHRLPGSSQ